MTKEVITTEKAPKALGPYSAGIKVGQFIYTAGQLGLDPVTNNLAEGIEAQTRHALTNLSAILEAAGGSMANVVKTTVFLQNLNDFAAMNAVYATFFGEKPPARSTVQVAALPKASLVEIEAIAILE